MSYYGEAYMTASFST
uniref:Uncharacterized protein n=1 Tax=Arundo donax TaxID=35708 RepID=A0A0A9EG11_ARUDO